MAKLTGFKEVAVIKQGYGDYHFAIYEDGHKYMPGDKVMVSNNNTVWEITDILTPEETEEKFGKNITAEVICPVDMTAYDERVEKRKRAEKIKKEMDKKIKELDEVQKYKIYADLDPEVAAMLAEYKELV